MLFAFVISVIVTLPLVMWLGWRRPGATKGETSAPSVLFFLLILFFGTWAGSAWLMPAGPTLGGTPWLSWLLFSFVIVLLLGAALHPPRPRMALGPDEDPATVQAGFGVMFWALLLVLCGAAVVRIALGS